MDFFSEDTDSEAANVECNAHTGDLQNLAGNVVTLEAKLAKAPLKPVITKRFENNIPVITADLTPRRKRGAKTPTQTPSRSPSPIAPSNKPRQRKTILEIAVTLDAGKVQLLPVYAGDTSSDVANRLLIEMSKSALKVLAEDIEREVNQYMVNISKELALYQRLSRESSEAKSRASLEKAKPPDLQTAKRARNKERRVLGAISIDNGSGSPWSISPWSSARSTALATPSSKRYQVRFRS